MIMVNAGASSCWLEGKAKTPAGTAEQMRPRRSESDEEAHRPPAESEALHGKQQRSSKQSRSCIQIVRLWVGFISLCLSLISIFYTLNFFKSVYKFETTE
jgi:hypothetical protein